MATVSEHLNGETEPAEESGRHRAAARRWTALECTLALACLALGVAILILGFTGIYLTVVPLLRPWWHWFSPWYLVVGEGSFAFAYLGLLLLEMRDHPPRRTRAFLAGDLAAAAAGSLALMTYAARGSFPDLVSHVVLCLFFFGAGIYAKVLVTRLATDPAKRESEQALADARQYASDLLRARVGWHWRYWGTPSLLRRQVLTGRLPDEVRSAVTAKLAEGQASGWQGAVRAWVLGPDGLSLAVQARADDAAARRSIERQARASEQGAADAPAASGERPRKRVTGSAQARVKAERLLRTDPHMETAAVVLQSGASRSTVQRLRRDMPRALHPVRSGMGD